MKNLRPHGDPQQPIHPLEPLLNEHEVARLTRRSVSSLRRDRLLGVGIPFVKYRALVRYEPRDVRDYLERNKHLVEQK